MPNIVRPRPCMRPLRIPRSAFDSPVCWRRPPWRSRRRFSRRAAGSSPEPPRRSRRGRWLRSTNPRHSISSRPHSTLISMENGGLLGVIGYEIPCDDEGDQSPRDELDDLRKEVEQRGDSAGRGGQKKEPDGRVVAAMAVGKRSVVADESRRRPEVPARRRFSSDRKPFRSASFPESHPGVPVAHFARTIYFSRVTPRCKAHSPIRACRIVIKTLPRRPS